jgi:3-phosphoglycerate kinase
MIELFVLKEQDVAHVGDQNTVLLEVDTGNPLDSLRIIGGTQIAKSLNTIQKFILIVLFIVLYKFIKNGGQSPEVLKRQILIVLREIVGHPDVVLGEWLWNLLVVF